MWLFYNFYLNQSGQLQFYMENLLTDATFPLGTRYLSSSFFMSKTKLLVIAFRLSMLMHTQVYIYNYIRASVLVLLAHSCLCWYYFVTIHRFFAL